jgi:hypothetical protein
MLSAEDVQKIISEIEQSAGASSGSGNLSEALALKDDPNATVYYADAFPRTKDGPAPTGAVSNILGFFNFDFLGQSDIGFKNISEARVLFFDAPQASGPRQASLVIGMKLSGNDSFTYYAFRGQGEIRDDVYEAFLEGGAGQPIIVRSYDIDSGLASVIQLKVFSESGNYLGKIATLNGYKY